jgi:hypothetical protein
MNATQVATLCHLPENEPRFVCSNFHQKITTQNLKLADLRSLLRQEHVVFHCLDWLDNFLANFLIR